MYNYCLYQIRWRDVVTECRVNTVWLNCYGDPKADRILNRAATNSKRQSSILLSLSLRHVLFRDTKTLSSYRIYWERLGVSEVLPVIPWKRCQTRCSENISERENEKSQERIVYQLLNRQTSEVWSKPGVVNRKTSASSYSILVCDQ